MEGELEISLPPGPLDRATSDALIAQLVGPGGWMQPTSWGTGEPDEKALRRGEDAAALLSDRLAQAGEVVFAQKGAGFILVKPDRRDLTYWGGVHIGSGSPDFFATMAARPDVPALMALLRAPLAVLATRDARAAFSKRLVPGRYGELEQGTVDGYHRGLEHPHWRMWFGPEWTEFLTRDALARAPAFVSRREGDGWFVQVHERPEQWDQPAGRAAAQQFAAALGKNVFYDPADPERTLAAPSFAPRMAAARAQHPSLKEFVAPALGAGPR